MHLAKTSVFLVNSWLLWAFDIVEKHNPLTGDAIMVDAIDSADGLILCLNKFPCDFYFRSKLQADAIQHALRGSPPQFMAFETGIWVEDAAYVERIRQML